MEFNEIKELVKLIDSSGITEFKLDIDNFSISMKKSTTIVEEIKREENRKVEIPEIVVDKEQAEAKGEDEDFYFIQSPILGTFYSSSSPEAEAYAKVGSKIKKGDVLCIVEAMKMMNEITSDVDGEIVDVLVENMSPVEYNQPLFKVRKV